MCRTTMSHGIRDRWRLAAEKKLSHARRDLASSNVPGQRIEIYLGPLPKSRAVVITHRRGVPKSLNTQSAVCQSTAAAHATLNSRETAAPPILDWLREHVVPVLRIPTLALQTSVVQLPLYRPTSGNQPTHIRTNHECNAKSQPMK